MSTATQILLLKVAAVLLITSLVSGCATHPVTIGSLAPLQDESEHGEVLKEVEVRKGISTGVWIGVGVGVAVALGSSGGGSGGDTSTPAPQPITCPRGQRLINGVCRAPPPPPIVCPGGQTLVNGVCTTPPPPPPVCEAGEELRNGECVSICRDGFVFTSSGCDPTFAYAQEVFFNGIVPGFGDVSTNSVYCEALKSSKSKVRYVLSNNVGEHQRDVQRYAEYLSQCIDSSGDTYRYFDVVRVDTSCSSDNIFRATSCGTTSNDIIVRPFAVNGNFAYVHEEDVGDYPALISSGDNRYNVDDPFRNWTREEVDILIAHIKKGNDNFIIITSSTGGTLRCISGADSGRVFPQEYYDLVCPRFVGLEAATRSTPTDEELEGTTFERLSEILNNGLGDEDFEDSIGTSFSAAAVGVVVTFIARYYDVNPDQALDIFVASTVSENGYNVANIRKLFDVSGVLMSRGRHT